VARVKQEKTDSARGRDRIRTNLWRGEDEQLQSPILTSGGGQYSRNSEMLSKGGTHRLHLRSYRGGTIIKSKYSKLKRPLRAREEKLIYNYGSVGGEKLLLKKNQSKYHLHAKRERARTTTLTKNPSDAGYPESMNWRNTLKRNSLPGHAVEE